MSEMQDVKALTSGLRELLLTPGKRISAAQQDEVSRRVNLLAVQYGNSEDDQSALECVALIGLAQIKGNKDAAKKSLNFGRWAEQPPPQLGALASDQERRGALKLLSAVRATWIAAYASAALSAAEQEAELTTDLVAWAYASSASAADFLESMANAIRDGAVSKAARLKQLPKLVLKNLSSHRQPAGERCADAFVQLASAVKEVVSKLSIVDKGAAELQDFVVQVVDLVTAQEPELLLNTGTAQALGTSESILSKWTSGSKRRLESLSGRMLSAGRLVEIGHVPGAAEDVGAIFKFAAEILPLEKTAKRLPKRQVLLKNLLQGLRGDEEATGTAVGSQDLLDQVASLMVAWDSVSGKLQNRNEFAEIELLIKGVSAAASVERFGEHGQAVPYRPLEQSLVEQEGSPPASVRIELPGVRVKREDGSYRILIKAVVTRM